MSLEEQIRKLTEAMTENTAVLKQLSGKTAAAAGAKSSTSATEAEDDPKGKSAKTTATKKVAPKEEPEEDEAPKKKPGRPAKEKVLSATDMGEKARVFCEAASDDEDEFKERRALVAKLAKKYGADRFSAINDPADQKAAIAALEEYAEGDDEGDEDGEDY